MRPSRLLLSAALASALATGAVLAPGTASAAPTPRPQAASVAPASAPTTVATWTLPRSVASIPSTWKLAFSKGYGSASGLLGTKKDAYGVVYGPENVAQAPDGTWWVVDETKHRLVHLKSTGAWIGAVALPTSWTSAGRYFLAPRVLADGTVIVPAADSELSSTYARRFLRVTSGKAVGISLAKPLVITSDDGTALYGYTVSGGMVSVNAKTGVIKGVPYFKTQGGNRYKVTVSADWTVTFALPDSKGSTKVVIHVKPAHGSTQDRPLAVRVAGGKDGTLFILGEHDSLGLSGYASISRNGVPTRQGTMRKLYSSLAVESPSVFGVRYGASSPYLGFVDSSALHVYVRR